MTAAPPSGDDPKDLDLKDLMQPPARNGRRFDWPKLIAGALASLSLIGAYVSNFASGGAARSAGRALSAEEQAAVHAAQVRENVTITQTMLERARERASDMEHRIGELEKQVAALVAKMGEGRQGKGTAP